MDITPKQGVCRFCGQIGVIDAPDIDQDRIDEMITHKCICQDAQEMRAEEERQAKIRESLTRAKKSISRIFGDDWKQAETFLTEIAPAVADGTIASVQIKRIDQDTVAVLKRKTDGTLKVSRKDSKTRTEE